MHKRLDIRGALGASHLPLSSFVCVFSSLPLKMKKSKIGQRNWVRSENPCVTIDIGRNPVSGLDLRKSCNKLLITFYLLFINNCISAQAQISADGTLSTNVTSDNINFTINDGDRAGNNLFHSFREFSIPTGGEAFFNNAADIQNIFSRVTGGNISNIDGLIRANGKANLFLLNPSGIIFGPNARLNIGGSFLASTATILVFADGTQFSTTNTQNPPLLTINVPVGLQYGTKSEPIRVQGAGQNLAIGATAAFESGLNLLEVQPGNTLTFAGGNVIVDGGILQAPGGRIELGGLASEGTITINGDGSLSFPANIPRADVSIINKAGINVLAGGGGNIAINAENIEISDESLLTTGIATGLGKIDAQAGNISLNAAKAITIAFSRIENNVNPEIDDQPAAIGNGGDINIQAGSIVTDSASLSTGTFGVGNAGNLTIAADAVSLTNGTLVQSSTSGIGNAGNILIQSNGSIDIIGDNTKIESDIFETANGGGNAGNIFVQANGLVNIFNGEITSEVLSKDATGKGGNISITGGSIRLDQNSLTRLETTTQGIGDAGNIFLEATSDNITIARSRITSDTFSAGNAGVISLVAKGLIDIVGSSINSQVNTGASGNSGIIVIDGGSVSIDGTTIQTSTVDGPGNAGSVLIKGSTSVTIVSSNITSNADKAATGDAGLLSIDGGTISIGGGAFIESSNFVGGKAGNILLGAKDISIANSIIFSDAFNDELNGGGLAGNIFITASDALAIANSKITAESFPKLEEANNFTEVGLIIIQAQDVSFSNQTQLSTSTYGNSKAGNIIIEAQSVSLTDAVRLESSTFGSGDAGNVVIDAKGIVRIINSNLLTNADATATGNAGLVSLKAGSIFIEDNSFIQSSNFVSGNAGNLLVEADDNISIVNSTLTSDTLNEFTNDGGGFAGNIFIAAGNAFTVVNSAIAAESYGSGEGDTSGNQSGLGFISIEARTVSLSDKVILSTNTFGTAGSGGDITILARSIRLNQSAITAETESANGGNITLKAPDLILIRRNSNISTTAGRAGAGGDGGNIEINTNNLVALENSDITANAFEGRGGRVTITAKSIFGAQAGMQATPNSDITAISQIGGPELSGTVELNTPDVDPSSGLIELPQNVVDITGLIDRRCSPAAQQSTFVATGRGGLPPSPTDPLNSTGFLVDLVEINPESQGRGNRQSRIELPSDNASQNNQIIEAQGWITNDKGQVVLVANPPTVTPHGSGIIPIECHVR